MAESVSALISNLVSAISNMSLYSKDHAAVLYFSEKAVSGMEGLYKDGVLSITMLGESLLHNDVRIQERGLHISNFTKRLRGKGIEKLIFRKGVTAPELMQFIAEMVGREGAAPSPSANISLGVMEVGLRGGEGGGLKAAVSESRPKVEEMHQSASKFKKLDMVGLEEAVSGYIATIKGELNVLSAIGPVKSHSEYTFAHAANVSILSMFMAQALGIGGETLRDIGLAGLLHDVGKASVPPEILEKTDKLKPQEWEEMKKHPIYGARYLCGLDDAPKTALIAAFEHHMRFDGTGYPDTMRRGKKQHIVSQIVSIADFFDALRTERPYRKALEIPVVFGLLREAAGTEFNPILVDGFIMAGRGILGGCNP